MTQIVRIGNETMIPKFKLGLLSAVPRTIISELSL